MNGLNIQVFLVTLYGDFSPFHGKTMTETWHLGLGMGTLMYMYGSKVTLTLLQTRHNNC